MKKIFEFVKKKICKINRKQIFFFSSRDSAPYGHTTGLRAHGAALAIPAVAAASLWRHWEETPSKIFFPGNLFLGKPYFYWKSIISVGFMGV